MALVPKQWYADANPNERNNYVEILARNSGLLAWLLALLRIDPTYFLSINHRRLVFQTASFTGYRKVIIPIDSISSSYYGYHKPWKQAVGIFFMALLAGGQIITASIGNARDADGPGVLWFGVGIVLLGLLIAVIYYFLNKQLVIGITDNNGADHEMVLKKSVIENKEINEQQMELVTRIVLTIIDNQKAQKLHNPSAIV